MKTSESVLEISKALLECQRNIKRVMGHDSKGYGYEYTSLKSIMSQISPALTTNGVILIQSASGDGNNVSITTRLQHISGEYIEDSLTLPPTNVKGANGVQQLGSSITYGRRYHIVAMLGLVADEDTDGADSRPVNKLESMPDNVKNAFRALGWSVSQVKEYCEKLNYNWQEIHKKLNEES